MLAVQLRLEELGSMVLDQNKWEAYSSAQCKSASSSWGSCLILHLLWWYIPSFLMNYYIVQKKKVFLKFEILWPLYIIKILCCWTLVLIKCPHIDLAQYSFIFFVDTLSFQNFQQENKEMPIFRTNSSNKRMITTTTTKTKFRN